MQPLQLFYTIIFALTASTSAYVPSMTRTQLKRQSINEIVTAKISYTSLSMANDDLDETVRKSGLEVGLFKAFTSKNNDGMKPKDLLAKYGFAYLATSITFAIISYAICYALISRGIDVNSLLEKVGISVSSSSNSAGTAALAYAVHKAASPIRFPPTVALTPVVAGWLGKKPKETSDSGPETTK